MSWIPSHQELGRHPKTLRAARLLGQSVPETMGQLHLLWHWCMDFAQDGDLARHDFADVAEAMMSQAEPQTLRAALIQCGFLDEEEGRLTVHDWHEYGGRLLLEKQAEAQRKKECRQKTAVKVGTANVSAGHPPDVRRMSGGREEERRTEEKTEDGKRQEEKRPDERTGEENGDVPAAGDSVPAGVRPLSSTADGTSLETPLALQVRQVCRKGRVLSPRDREKLSLVIAGLQRESATVEQVQEFGRKCSNHWIGRDSQTKEARAPGIMQVLEHWHEILTLPDPPKRHTRAELDAIARKYAWDSIKTTSGDEES